MTSKSLRSSRFCARLSQLWSWSPPSETVRATPLITCSFMMITNTGLLKKKKTTYMFIAQVDTVEKKTIILNACPVYKPNVWSQRRFAVSVQNVWYVRNKPPCTRSLPPHHPHAQTFIQWLTQTHTIRADTSAPRQKSQTSVWQMNASDWPITTMFRLPKSTFLTGMRCQHEPKSHTAHFSRKPLLYF